MGDRRFLSGGTSFNSDVWRYLVVDWDCDLRDDIGRSRSSAAPGACCFANGTCTSVLMNVILPVALLKVATPAVLHHHVLPPTVGACCFGSECSELTPAGCENGGGIFNGLGSSCADNVCAPRACCLTTGDCVILVPDTCSAVGGTSDAADCASSSCAPPACLEDLNDNGSVDFADLLEVLGSWGAVVVAMKTSTATASWDSTTS